MTSAWASIAAGSLLVVAVVEQAVAVIDDGHLCEEIALERILRIVVEDRRCPADRLRPEPGARPVGGCGIEGDAPDDRIGTRQILGETAAHERQCAGKRRVRRGRGQAFCSEGMVDRLFCHGVPPSLRWRDVGQ
jgi:hypothetical protein